MQKFSDTVSTTNGTQLEVLSSATVTVYLAGTTTLASIFSDNGVTAKANPFLSSITGRIEFYAADGRYDLNVAKTGFSPVVVADVLLEDPDGIDDDLDGINISNSTLTNCTLEGSAIETVSSVEFNTATPGAGGVGVMKWNPDEETLDLGLNSDVTLQMGQEIVYHVTNNTGSAIANGAAVRANGTTGNSGKILIALAQADGSQPSKTFMGIATEPIGTGTQGFVTHFGKVRGIQTNGANYGEMWADGDILYVSQTTPGALTNVQPAANGGDVVTAAIVIHAHPSNGTLFVRPTFDSHGSDVVKYLPAGAGAVSTNVREKLREFVSPEDKGAVGDNSTDDYLAFQRAIDDVAAAGGGTVRCAAGKTYRLTTSPIVKDRVTLDLNGATLRLTLVGTGGYDYGVRVRNYAALLNGTVNVESTGAVGSQAGIHSPISIGPLYGDGGTVASPSADEGVTNWTLRDLKLSTNRTGKVGIQVMGGANNGVIENIEVPDSAVMYGAVHLDWGFVGTISSGDIPGSRANFDANTAYTTHPNNILIRNIKVGALSVAKGGVDVGSHIVRLSGVYNIRVENVKAKQCTYAGVKVTAGDLGFEFAPAAIKPLRMKGIVIEGVAIEDTTDSWLAYADSYADNIANEGGYTPLIDPLHETDMEIRHVTGKGSGSASVTPGLEVRQIRGGRFTDIDASGYQYGCLVEEKTYGVQIHGCFHSNRRHGVYIHHGTFKPEDVWILPGTHCFSNGQDGGFANQAGIAIQGSIRCRVDGALLGHRTGASETTQGRGLDVVDTSAVDVEVENCHVFSVKTAGIAYVLMTSTDYGSVRLFRNNTVNSAVTNKYSGVNIVPINRFLATDGTEVAHYTASRFSLSADITPTAGTWVAGDTIFHSNPTGGATGSRCETGGSPGTWGAF